MPDAIPYDPQMPNAAAESYTAPGVPPIAAAILNKYKSDPAFEAPGAPPNYGDWVLPQVMTMQGLVSNISKVYRMSDEALKNSLEDARFMELDVGIQECIQARTRSTALLNWHLEPDDPTSSEQVALCDEMEKILKRCPRFMQLRESLMAACWYGRTAVTFRYTWDKFTNRMLVAPTAWRPVHGDKLVFRLDEGRFDVDPNQVGIRVGMTYAANEKIGGRWELEQTDRGMAYFLSASERRLLAIHKHVMQDGAYEEPSDAGRIHGVGIRSFIYWEWYQKQETLRWLMEYLERSAFGIELWFYPESNAGAKVKAEQAAKSRINNFRNIIFVPLPGEDGTRNQYGVQHIETGMAGVEALMNLLNNYFGHRMKRLILGQTLTSESEGGGLGSDGIAKVHLGTFKDIVRYDATNLEETITEEIVRPLKEWNFKGSGHFNVRFVIETEEVDADEKLEQCKLLWDMGADLSEKELMEHVGLTKPGPDDKILRNPQIAAAFQQMRMQAAGMGGQPGQPGQQPQPISALGQKFQDAIRSTGHEARIKSAGQRTIMGDHFDEGMHQHAVAGQLDNAFLGHGGGQMAG
jgi:hypothetical protein